MNEVMESLSLMLEGKEPILVPTPRKMRTGRGQVLAETGITVRRDSGLGPQSYRLGIRAGEGDGPGQVVIETADDAGERHARATLAQLHRQYIRQLPELEIEDSPAFAVRGVMLDVSRDRVPTMGQLFETVDLLASLKYNHLQLYTEHTFAYAGHEGVWEGWSPITPAEVRELDSYCAARGVELAANQNCFGHLGKWLKHPRYGVLAETHGDWLFDNAWPMSGAFSLCPSDPGSIALIEDLLSQLSPCFKSPLVNIGCDETFDLEFGRSKEECARRGRAAVYMEFVRKICDAARRNGKRPMFWADIALSHPEALEEAPEDLVSLAWGYEPDAAFERWCEAGRGAGRKRDVWVCPGTSTWRAITGRTMERRENLKAAMVGGLKGVASGYLVTDWGDTGHHQQWPLTAHALAQGAEAAWRGEGELDTADASSLHVLGDRSLRVGRWLDELGDADLMLRETCGQLSRPDRVRLRNQTAIFIDLLKGPGEHVEVGRLADWESVRERVWEIGSRRPVVGDERVDAELAHTCKFARFAADRGAWRRVGGGAGGLTSQQRKDLGRRLGGIVEEHRRLWGMRSREGGLGSSCAHMEKWKGWLKG